MSLFGKYGPHLLEEFLMVDYPICVNCKSEVDAVTNEEEHYVVVSPKGTGMLSVPIPVASAELATDLAAIILEFTRKEAE